MTASPPSTCSRFSSPIRSCSPTALTTVTPSAALPPRGIIAVGVNADGRREVLGMEIGTSEAEPIWTEFLRKLTRRGLRGVKLVVSDAHEGIKAAVSKVRHPQALTSGLFACIALV